MEISASLLVLSDPEPTRRSSFLTQKNISEQHRSSEKQCWELEVRYNTYSMLVLRYYYTMSVEGSLESDFEKSGRQHVKIRYHASVA